MPEIRVATSPPALPARGSRFAARRFYQFDRPWPSPRGADQLVHVARVGRGKDIHGCAVFELRSMLLRAANGFTVRLSILTDSNPGLPGPAAEHSRSVAVVPPSPIS